MAELILSPVIGLIVDKLANPVLDWIWNRSDLKVNTEKLRHSLLLLRSLLEDAQEQQAINTAVEVWLLRFKEVAYKAEELLLILFSAESSFAHVNKMKQMLPTLEMAVDEGIRLINSREKTMVHKEWSRRETSSFVVENEVYGREGDKEEIVKLLLSCETMGGGEAMRIPIIGIGGIGKTTLAQLAYHDPRVTHHFDVKVWVFVSVQFHANNIMTKVMESCTNDKCLYSNMDALQSAISSLLRDKRYLIVLDDVWTEDQDDWDKLRPLFMGGIDGSKILITTRSKRVAFITNSPTFPYYVKELSEDACWSLFRQRAFRPGEEEQHPTLLPIGQEIIRKCGGVALAAKTLGSLMRFKRDLGEWKFIRDSELWNLDEFEGGILPALRLSYYHLPLHLKRCFAFCSLFPRSYEFKKDKLIHLWMAEGFIDRGNKSKEPEDFGNDYFNDLQWMSFLQEIKQGEKGVVTGYKMHDLIYDLAKSVTSSEYTVVDSSVATPMSVSQIRHSSIVCGFSSSMIPEQLYEASHLRTLLLFSAGNVEQVPSQLYSSFKYLAVLDLCGSGLMILDGFLGSLLHLKFLDLSHTHIRMLPPEIVGLRSLQTLNLFNCYNLVALPDLRKLTSLRHLNNDGCRNLTRVVEGDRQSSHYDGQLQTLPLYVVGGAADMFFLEKIQLRGSLKITHLENAGTARIEMKKKEGLESLGLYWGSDDDYPNVEPEEVSVLSRFRETKQTLQPEPLLIQADDPYKPYKQRNLLRRLELPCYLKRLLIKGYSGYSFPCWTVPYLEVVSLIDCRISGKLPILGNLQSLTRLLLQGMHGVSRIGKEFYGDSKDMTFPVLKELVLTDFPNLEEWLSPDMGGNAFPNLTKLIINKCPKLNDMPRVLFIQHLDLRDCSAALLRSFQNVRTLETLVIENVNDLSYFPGAFPINNPLLTKLEIRSCPKLSFLPHDLENLAALKSLVIRWCQGLKSLPRSLQYLSALESLEIGDCDSLTSLPNDGNRGLSNLQSLSIENCNSLRSLSMGFQYLTSLEILNIMYCPSIVELPGSLEHLSALRSLSILCCPQLNYLPDELQNLVALHRLEIRSCPGLQVLPEWIEKLVSLRSLAISGCHNIGFLPEAIEGLTALQHLSIHDCPQLVRRCRQEQGEDWPKIAHVPYKHIESPNLKRPREEGSSSSNF